jgi:hypothetical protein
MAWWKTSAFGNQHTSESRNVATFLTVAGYVLSGLGRLVPHWWNFVPLGACTMFSAATHGVFRATTASAFVLCVTDVLLWFFVYGPRGYSLFYWGRLWDYLGFLLYAVAGSVLLRRARLWSVPMVSLGGSLSFFLVSNFGVWLSGFGYPKTPEGLVRCYVNAIPFFHGTLWGDLLFSSLLWGAYHCLLLGQRSASMVPSAPAADGAVAHVEAGASG